MNEWENQALISAIESNGIEARNVRSKVINKEGIQLEHIELIATK